MRTFSALCSTIGTISRSGSYEHYLETTATPECRDTLAAESSHAFNTQYTLNKDFEVDATSDTAPTEIFMSRAAHLLFRRQKSPACADQARFGTGF